MQFMLYKDNVSKAEEKRAMKGSNNVTALEVWTVAKLGATVTTYFLLVVKSTGHNREQKTTLQMFCFLPLVFCCKIISKGRKTHVPLIVQSNCCSSVHDQGGACEGC
ncbi:unnamed protein product [Brassica oleracea]